MVPKRTILFEQYSQLKICFSFMDLRLYFFKEAFVRIWTIPGIVNGFSGGSAILYMTIPNKVWPNGKIGTDMPRGEGHVVNISRG